MSEYSQDGRTIGISTPLGKDVLLLRAFHGVEEMSRLFRYQLELFSEKDDLSPKDIIGKNVTFHVKLLNDTPRVFNGHVVRFSCKGKGDRLAHYTAEVVPWLWFLTQTRDCKVFQDKTVPAIITSIFDELGFADYEIGEISGSHVPWENCVQYNETDFNFISRLMEQEGIFYYFKHEDGRHVLVLADQKNAYTSAQETDVRFAGNLSEGDDFDTITSWEHAFAFHPGKVVQDDYDFKTPSASLLTNTSTMTKVDGADKYEVFEFPGEYEKRADGESDTTVRMEELEAGHDTVRGTSTCRSFGPGIKFKVAAHHLASEEGRSFTLVGVRHSASLGGAYLTGSDPQGASYTNHFVAIPDTTTFRPERSTSKPRIRGVQTAVVVGNGQGSNEEIQVDKFGRVRAQFFWDRYGSKGSTASCWMRVAQVWAGNGRGFQFIPRVGDEVVVSYLEGDPDQPIIVGSVYHGENKFPYDMPSKKNHSGIKSRSTTGGSSSNCNEIRLEDTKGSELFFVQAEKDWNAIVKNDSVAKIGNDETCTVEKGNRAVEISMGNDQLAIKMGNRTTKLDLGKDSTEAMQSIELKVGQSSIKIDQTGVTIKGMIVKVEGQIQTSIKGMMTDIKGDAILKAGGGLTMIG